MVLFSHHNIPYADLNDFGPDIQGALVSLFIQLEGGLALLVACLEEGEFNVAKLEREARCTDTTATELADELTRCAGLSFQEAHALAARLVKALCQQGRQLQSATPADLIALGGPAVDAALLRQALDPHAFVARRNGFGGPAPERVREQLEAAKAQLAANRDRLATHRAGIADARRNLSTLRQGVI